MPGLLRVLALTRLCASFRMIMIDSYSAETGDGGFQAWKWQGRGHRGAHLAGGGCALGLLAPFAGALGPAWFCSRGAVKSSSSLAAEAGWRVSSKCVGNASLHECTTQSSSQVSSLHAKAFSWHTLGLLPRVFQTTASDISTRWFSIIHGMILMCLS